MNEPLRPMNLGEILDRTFEIYRSRFIAFLAVAAIPALIVDFIFLADENWIHVRSMVQPGWTKSGLFFWNFVVSLGFYHVSSIIYLLTYPAQIKLVSGAILGEDCWLLRSLRFAASRWRSSLWIAVLKTAAVLVVPELIAAGILFVEAVLLMATKSRAPVGIGSVLVFAMPALVGIILFLWWGASLSLAFPVAAIEEVGGMESLRRSRNLSRGTRTRIILVWIAIFASLWVLVWLFEYLLGQVLFFVGQQFHLANAMRALFGPAVFVVVTAIYVLIGPIYPIALTLFYYDQRIRREGYDIERLMDAAGMGTQIALPAEDSSLESV
jgi:hypothetical protein